MIRLHTSQADGRAVSWLARMLAAKDPGPASLSFLAAALCLAVGVIHVQDQGRFLGDVSPEWIAVGYYAIEIVAGLTALLLARQLAMAWLFALSVSGIPATFYTLSRSVGLPGDSKDIGNWGYTLGTTSLVVEGLLFGLCLVALRSLLPIMRKRSAQNPADPGRAEPQAYTRAPS
jgi:hypothetical protein